MADGGVRLTAQQVDITTLDVDAIVNAANTHLAPGGGVCGAIFRAAGPGLAGACQSLAPCPVGQARLTPGFNLLARFIVHAVGPVWSGGASGEPDLLASAYRSAMAIARREGFRSIAFPAISTGVYGYPLVEATRVAVNAVRVDLARGGPVERVVFSCFDRATLHAYADAGVPIAPDFGGAT
jgi:O-acetyl-ADP-ribose deacetylase (regulator of RNase III)